ncbi:hypothetical protein [Pseudomonas sp. 58 R 3]|nr:hypothetical protein [Pseudomonas sp. 58 R 3]
MLFCQQLEQTLRPSGLDVPENLSAQAYRHAHARRRPNQQQVDQHLAGDFAHQLIHILRRQQAHPADHRRHVNEQQRLITEYQQAVGDRVVAECQQLIKLGLGDVRQQLFAVGLDVRQQLIQLRQVVPKGVERRAHAMENRFLQHPALVERFSVGINYPLRLEGVVPGFTQALFQPRNH